MALVCPKKDEKDLQVRDRIFLNVLVKRDGMSVTGAARFLGMAPSWGVKWHNRYLRRAYADPHPLREGDLHCSRLYELGFSYIRIRSG